MPPHGQRCSDDVLQWTPPAGEPAERFFPGGLPRGAECEICGLGQRPELNGAPAHPEAWHPDKGRYQVALRKGGTILVRPGNLVRLWPRVTGPSRPAADPSAGFLQLPLRIDEALDWEDETQRRTNAAATAAGGERAPVPPECAKGLAVRQSLIAAGGDGLFTDAAVAAGAVLCGFGGVLRGGELGPASDAYAQRVGGVGCVEGDMDCRDPLRGTAQWANDAACFGEGVARGGVEAALRQYAERAAAGRNAVAACVEGAPCLVALRPISPGEEVLHAYGGGYWLMRLRRAALLAHDLVLARECDAAYPVAAALERELFDSDADPLPWEPVPSLALDPRCCPGPSGKVTALPFYLKSFGVVDATTGECATAQQCRTLLWARLGVEGFALEGLGQCHFPATCASLQGVAPAAVPQRCADLRAAKPSALPPPPAAKGDDELLSFITADD
eukprot:TRINITY_DN20086_c0_g1_i2.p1 TRINITY_DN20086_c0_g1~~TRINITY_DN20086_c0_g1_i2.p1  ORF type:complete len:468 (+),score=124.85 TRINITY_DN20086_c0_g1_i2:68-1405(+)